MTVTDDALRAGAEIERLIGELSSVSDGAARGQAQELVRLLLTLYGTGLARMLDVVRTEQGGPDAVLRRFAADGLISSLLVLHDLHPESTEVRVRRALALLEPYLPPDVTLSAVTVDATRVHLRVSVASHSPAGAAGLRASVERAVREAAPEVDAIEMEGLDDAGLIQIRRRGDRTGEGANP